MSNEITLMKKRYLLPQLGGGLALAALLPLRSAAGVNTWENTAGNFWWDETTANWLSPVTWSDGDDAVFGPTGVGAILLNSPVTVANMAFNRAGYSLTGNGMTLTVGGTTPTITANESVTIAAQLDGVAGLTFAGTNATTLQGDAGVANTYSGGTFIRSGTVVLQAARATSGGGSYGVADVEELDPGATLQIGTTWNSNGAVNNSNNTYTINYTVNGQIYTTSTNALHLTGGTLDMNGDNGKNYVPIFDGTGVITNSSPATSGTLTVFCDGQTHEFSGVIADGPAYQTAGNGNQPFQIRILDLHYGVSGGLLVLSGPNTYSGSTRLGNGSIQMSGAGTLGVPSAIPGLTGPMRIYGPNYLDLNGTSQTIGAMASVSPPGTVLNSAPGTISTFSLGYGPNTNSTTTTFEDNSGSGGILALTKVGTSQLGLGGNSTYSGDTSVAGGVLALTAASAVSPNTSFLLSSSGGILALTYSGSAPVMGLSLNGVPQPNGVYGAASVPEIAGSGTLQVSGSPLWNNGTGNFLWNHTSLNWVGGSIWVDGGIAIFGAAGVGDVSLSEPVTARNLVFNTAGYTLTGAGNPLAMAGATPTIYANAAATIDASLEGTNGLSFEGTGPVTLGGDAASGFANQYSGGTSIKSGTVILQAPMASSAGGSYGVAAVNELDAGATLQIGTTWNSNGAVNNSNNTYSINYTVNGQIYTTGTNALHLTGGTLDMNGDNGKNYVPIFDGTGVITNSSPATSGTLTVFCDGQTHEFSGVIADGPAYQTAGNGNQPFQIRILDLHYGVGGGTLVLSGPNTYSGSTRLGNASIRMKGAGTLGVPSAIPGLTGPMRVYGPYYLDLNGTSQTIGAMASVSPAGTVLNSAPGTVSTFSIGYGPNTNSTTTTFEDNAGSGGVLALTKVGTSQFGMGGISTYSGDTTVSAGVLALTAASAASPNSVYRLSTAQGLLALTFSGTAPVKSLYVNGVQMPNGIYGANNVPAIAGPGLLQVTASTARPPITITPSGSGSGSLTVSWPAAYGSFKVQAKTNSLTGAWFDYPGGSANPLTIPVDGAQQEVFFRLAPR